MIFRTYLLCMRTLFEVVMISSLSIVNMSSSIQLFQCVQKYHKIVGIQPSQPNQKRYPINWAKTLFLIGCAVCMITSGAFFVFKSKSLFDYGFSFYTCTASINVTIIYVSFIWKSQMTLEFIGNCEGFIEKSKN